MNCQSCEKSYDFTYNQACGTFPDPTSGYTLSVVSRDHFDFGKVYSREYTQQEHLDQVRLKRAVCKIVCPVMLTGIMFTIAGCLAISHECDDDFDDCNQKNPNSYPDVQAMYIVAGVVGAFALSCIFNTLYPICKYNSLSKPKPNSLTSPLVGGPQTV